jgi:SAM-dependent methyltransferase
VTELRQVLANARHRVGAFRRRVRQNEGMDRTFGRFYARNLWRGEESVSGPGSSVATTTTVRAELGELLRQFAVGSVLDIPCGDFNWMKEVPLDGVEYIGADIVPAMIEEDRRRYASGNRSFLVLDAASSDLPRVVREGHPQDAGEFPAQRVPVPAGHDLPRSAGQRGHHHR